jgi:hypothetical protein
MADPYFQYVTAQFRATRQNVLDLNSAIPYGWYARATTNLRGNSPTISSEYSFLNPFSFKFIKPQVLALEPYFDNGTNLIDPTRFMSNDFCVEGRFYLLSLATVVVLFDSWTSTNGWKIVVNTNGTVQLNERNLSVTLISLVGGPLVQINTPFHIALTRTGSILRLFLNGVNVAQTTLLTPHAWTTASPGTLNIGGQWNTRVTTTDMDGYADDIRVTKGFSRYTANFTPPVVTDFSEFYLPDAGSSKYYTIPDINYIGYAAKDKSFGGFKNDFGFLNEINDFFLGSNSFGDGEITDVVSVDDTPAIRKTSILERESKILARLQYSKPNGSYHFKGLDKNLNYMLIAEDNKDSSPRKNAAIRDFVRCIPKIILTKIPTNFTSGQRSQMFEIRAINFDVPVVVTLSSPDDLTFSNTSITILPINKTGYFTVTPATVGNKTISFTNSVNSNNPTDFDFIAG